MAFPTEYSVIIPVYNEYESIKPLCASLKGVMDRLGQSYEVIVVNDGSSDQTAQEMNNILPEWKELAAVHFEQRRGKSAALKAGIDYARGRRIITMDGDLQNDPADIPKLLKKMDEGYDVVCGWRRRRHDPWDKKLISLIANCIRRAAYRENIHDVGCALRVYVAGFIKDINLSGQEHRFLTAILKKKGARMAEVEVTHHPRQFGKSKYGEMERTFDSIPDFLALLIKKEQ